jgi:Coenzyme PQQ synthesis protein D (PqqD)
MPDTPKVRTGEDGGSNLRPRPGVVAREMEGIAVLIHLETNRIYELNGSGARIWTLLEQGLGRNAICTRLRADFDAPEGEIEQTVDALLSDLTREGLVGG